MENASKALIIAGAILIAIVLITFGVIILGQGSEIINNSSMSETEVAAFNAKFTAFEGTKVRGSKVNSLLNTVLQHNLSQVDDSTKVTVNGISSATNGIKITINDDKIDTKAQTGTTYTVECNYAANGLITDISVTTPKT